MDINFTNPLPWGRSGFSDIRNAKQIYVDKTDMLAQIACQRTPFFLSRPRRFGKSLLINTFKSLFSKGLEDFQGLAIENLWTDKTYPVVRIDFSCIADNDSQKINNVLTKILIRVFNVREKVSLFDAPGIYADPISVLDEILYDLKDGSVVLLIDEYDSPLTHHLHEPEELSCLTKLFNNFYSTIKSYIQKFRFVFITGVTRIAHISLFSSFNNLRDISFKKEYNTLLGFTQNEIKKYFSQYIENAAKLLKIPTIDIYSTLKNFYDGYQFSISADETVYSPWSILSFLLEPNSGFKNYWFESSGSPSIIINYLKIHKDFSIWELNKQELFITETELEAKSEACEMSPKLLLNQAGYLTLREKDQALARLVFPNTEVEESMLSLSLTAQNMQISPSLRGSLSQLCKAIDENDLKSIIDFFNEILNDCVLSQSMFFQDENTLRDLFFAIIPYTPAIIKQKERTYAKGRSDLELITHKTHLVIEFKRTYPSTNKKKGRDGASSLKEGISQLLSRRYGEGSFSTLQLWRIVLVAGTEERRFLPEFCQVVQNSPRVTPQLH